jgi:hypothetical protein
MATILWRVEGTSMEPNLAAWQQGLTLHLLFQPLTLITARRDGRMRHYLALNACPGCRLDGCDRMCHRALFEQLVRTTLPGVTLVPAPRLVASPSETRRAAATPLTARARPLDDTFLAQWDEGRLITTWSRLQASPQPVRAGALLAVGQEGPEPGRALRACGWRNRPLAALACRATFAAEAPGPVPFSERADETLFSWLRDPVAFTGTPLEEAAICHGPREWEYEDEQVIEGEIIACDELEGS